MKLIIVHIQGCELFRILLLLKNVFIVEMNSFVLTLHSPEETRKFGVKLGQIALPGDVICLDGDLGAGKTTLTQAIAEGLQVPDECYVTSPSFAIFHEYAGRMPLYHIDFYRLSSVEEVEELGLEEFFYGSGLTVIEWPERAEQLIPSSRLYLNMKVAGEESRRIKCDPGTGEWQERINKITFI